MLVSVTHPTPSAHPDADYEDNPHDMRLRGLTRQQLEDRLAWLSWYNPGAFTATMDYMDHVDAIAAGTDPTPGGDPAGDGEPAPYCLRCGGDIGIFIRFGLDWRHYRGIGFDEIELTDPGHAPQVGLRAGASMAA